MERMKRVHVIVHGMVQGVGYRLHDAHGRAAGRGRRLGAQSPDGSVEAEIEGAPAQVDEVLAWMAQGPPGAHVDTAMVTDAAPTGERQFEVIG